LDLAEEAVQLFCLIQKKNVKILDQVEDCLQSGKQAFSL
jgi:hypothetical protein